MEDIRLTPTRLTRACTIRTSAGDLRAGHRDLKLSRHPHLRVDATCAAALLAEHERVTAKIGGCPRGHRRGRALCARLAELPRCMLSASSQDLTINSVQASREPMMAAGQALTVLSAAMLHRSPCPSRKPCPRSSGVDQRLAASPRGEPHLAAGGRRDPPRTAAVSSPRESTARRLIRSHPSDPFRPWTSHHAPHPSGRAVRRPVADAARLHVGLRPCSRHTIRHPSEISVAGSSAPSVGTTPTPGENSGSVHGAQHRPAACRGELDRRLGRVRRCQGLPGPLRQHPARRAQGRARRLRAGALRAGAAPLRPWFRHRPRLPPARHRGAQDGIPFNLADGSGDFYQIDPLALALGRDLQGWQRADLRPRQRSAARSNFVTPTA